MGLEGAGWSKGSQRVSRGSLGIEAFTSTRTQIRAWERSWATLGVCGYSERLQAPGGTLETFWELPGSSGSTFWEHFLSEKQFFAILNRKKYEKRVST